MILIIYTSCHFYGSRIYRSVLLHASVCCFTFFVLYQLYLCILKYFFPVHYTKLLNNTLNAELLPLQTDVDKEKFYVQTFHLPFKEDELHEFRWYIISSCTNNTVVVVCYLPILNVPNLCSWYLCYFVNLQATIKRKQHFFKSNGKVMYKEGTLVYCWF